MNIAVLLTIHAIVIISLVVLVSLKYGTMLNPVSVIGSWYFVSTVLGPLLYLKLGLLRVSKDAIEHAVLLSSLYFAAFGITYLLKFSPLRSPLKALVGVSRPFIIPSRTGLAGLGMAVLALQFIAVYVTLMVTSGAGLLWLTDSRTAYMEHKSGVGIWWALAGATLLLLFVVRLFRREHTPLKVAVETFLFSSVAFFLGSKGLVLFYLVLGAFYVHFCIRRIRTRMLVLGSVLLLLLAMALQLIQHTADTVLATFKYFDYFNTSATILDHFRHHGFQYGRIAISNLWLYVPRALYSAKPFIYGRNTLLNWIHPGFESVARRTGFYPGMLPWCAGYADFGVLGVVVDAAVTAWISKSAFEYFLDNRDCPSLFVMAQVAFLPCLEAFGNAPFPLFWAWFMAQGMVFWLLNTMRPNYSTLALAAE